MHHSREFIPSSPKKKALFESELHSDDISPQHLSVPWEGHEKEIGCGAWNQDDETEDSSNSTDSDDKSPERCLEVYGRALESAKCTIQWLRFQVVVLLLIVALLSTTNLVTALIKCRDVRSKSNVGWTVLFMALCRELGVADWLKVARGGAFQWLTELARQ